MPDSKLPGDTVFVCNMGLLYTGTTRVTPNAEGFSGVLPLQLSCVCCVIFSSDENAGDVKRCRAGLTFRK